MGYCLFVTERPEKRRIICMNTTQSQSYLDTVNHNKKRVISLIKYTLVPIAIIFVLLAVALLVEIIGVPKTVTLEAGEELPSAAQVSGKKDASYLDEESIDVSEVGEYDVVVEYGKKNSMKISPYLNIFSISNYL